MPDIRKLGLHRVFALARIPKVRVCYALATDGAARYVDLASISALAVKKFHPEADITILTDDQSLPFVRASLGSGWLGDRVRSVGAHPDGPGARSRFVKTQARQFMEGDFLYLDADAIPVAAFDAVFRERAHLAAAIDRSPANPDGSGFPHWAEKGFDHLKWPHPTPRYLNGGVVYWRDTPESRRFGVAWHANWRLFYEASADFADQPPFNHTLSAHNIKVKTMSDKYNARIGLSHKFAASAKIYHFYANDESISGFLAVEQIIDAHRKNLPIDRQRIDEALRHSHSRPVSNRAPTSG